MIALDIREDINRTQGTTYEVSRETDSELDPIEFKLPCNFATMHLDMTSDTQIGQ